MNRHVSADVTACLSRGLLVALTAACLTSAIGCSGQPTDQPPLAPVTGRVTMDGKPLVGKEVVFAPDASGRASIGMTDENGEYRMKYTFEWEGAMIGSHKVTITTPRPQNPGGNGGRWQETVPLRFNGETVLTAVVEDKQNVLNFELESE